MSLIPWREQQEGPLSLHDQFKEFWKDDFFRNLREPFDGMSNRLPAVLQASHQPAMNLSETAKKFLVTLELPGMDAKDIHIEIMGRQLQISGERKWEGGKKGREYHRLESQYGTFARSLTLPENAKTDRDSIDATFQKGMLKIRIPKIEPTPAAKIPVKSK